MHFESNWIVWLKDMAAALMSGTVCDHEKVKNVIVASPPLISPTIILSTIKFPFVLPSQLKMRDTVMQKRALIDISKHVASILHSLMCLFHWLHTNLLITIENGVKLYRRPLINSLGLKQWLLKCHTWTYLHSM